MVQPPTWYLYTGHLPGFRSAMCTQGYHQRGYSLSLYVYCSMIWEMGLFRSVPSSGRANGYWNCWFPRCRYIKHTPITGRCYSGVSYLKSLTAVGGTNPCLL